ACSRLPFGADEADLDEVADGARDPAGAGVQPFREFGGGHPPAVADQERREDAGGETGKAGGGEGGCGALGETADLVHRVLAHGTPLGRLTGRILQQHELSETIESLCERWQARDARVATHAV